jgi:hypothetical protein
MDRDAVNLDALRLSVIEDEELYTSELKKKISRKQKGV